MKSFFEIKTKYYFWIRCQCFGLSPFPPFFTHTRTHTQTYLHMHIYTARKAVGGIGLYVSVGKTQHMCFNQNQTRDIFTLSSSSLKLVDKFTSQRLIYRKLYQYATSQSMASYRKATGDGKLDLTDKIKLNFSKQQSCPRYSMDAPLTKKNNFIKSLTAIA